MELLKFIKKKMKLALPGWHCYGIAIGESRLALPVILGQTQGKLFLVYLFRKIGADLG